jgi:phosphoribosylformimino-5-aminoimidazole carboxamide ribotide isomerase
VLIPSIDLLGGRVVQLRRGEELVLQSDDIDGWLDRFAASPLIQVIDLDLAFGRPGNDAIVRRLCGARPCQVGGGVRTPERARALVDAGARRVIAGSALYHVDGVNARSAAAFHAAVGSDALIAAIDSRGGHVVTHGWTREIRLTPAAAAAALEPFVGAFLATFVETEGTMSGLDLTPVHALRAATTRRLIVAGGIRSVKEVETLDRLGVDAVVGMALYTGAMTPGRPGGHGRSVRAAR